MTDNAKSPILSKNVSSSIGLEPPLRFPGFEGEWLPTTIGEICDFQNGKAHEKDVDEFGKFIIVNSKFISSDGTITKYSNKQICPLYKNDIVMVMSDVPKGKAIAKCLLIDKDNKYTLNQRICSLRAKETPFFYLLQINRNDYFLKFDDGVKQTNLRKEDILSCPIYKTMLQEQQKIADFLSLVDERIEKQRQLVEVLKRYKRGLLFDIFNRKIQLGNNSAWRSVMLSDCCAGFDNMRKPISSELREKGTVPYYGANGVQDYVKDYIFDGNYVLLAEDGGRFDEFYSMPIAQFITGKSWVNNHAHVLQALRGFDTKFIYYALVHKDIRKYINGSSRAKLNQEDMWQIKIYTPCFDDQKKIASFMTVVDNMINQHEFRLAKLTDLKNAFLQQMFI